jgi:hypothetical protein
VLLRHAPLVRGPASAHLGLRGAHHSPRGWPCWPGTRFDPRVKPQVRGLLGSRDRT